MSRRDYLKHLGFATAQAMANANKTQIMALPQEIAEHIEQQAKKYAQVRCNDFEGKKHLHRKTLLMYAHQAGAIEWAGKAQGMVDALEMARREIVALYKTKGYSESFVTRTIDEAIAKYKEVTNEG